MKRYFSIGILLLICAHWANSAAIPVKRGIDEQTRRELAEINDSRKKMAEQLQIANMHELVYDDNLEKRASQLTCETTLSDAMGVPMPTEQDIAKMRSLPEGGDQEKAKQVLGVLIYYAVEVLINPEQSRVGCATINLKCNLPGVGGPPVPLNGPICLVGPKSSISKSDYKQGPPGSQCPDGKASSGLCKSDFLTFAWHFSALKGGVR
ncbi:hypothetical protein B9Z55_012109 [Caenorhabditis nigoni]|uniref:SCP domain-containing protein n=1 Tax=Caenorhabditis nigoni TaxID=1611254 RepID=A0A2G5TVR7_9PELO|nr:hypothetical protein B9Z55_012109 [Caenorhabditis nigoni]